MRSTDPLSPKWRRSVLHGIGLLGLASAGAALLVFADVAGREAGQRWPTRHVTHRQPERSAWSPAARTPLRVESLAVGASGQAAGSLADGADGATPISGGAVLLAEGDALTDVHAVARCRPDPTRDMRACGIVFRWIDAETHTVARLDLAAQRVVVEQVDRGPPRRLVLASAPLPRAVHQDEDGAKDEAWRSLEVEARSDRVRVSVDGERVLDALVPVASAPGLAGLWAPPGGVAVFDAVAIGPLR